MSGDGGLKQKLMNSRYGTDISIDLRQNLLDFVEIHYQKKGNTFIPCFEIFLSIQL